jgi:hypothetical protein
VPPASSAAGAVFVTVNNGFVAVVTGHVEQETPPLAESVFSTCRTPSVSVAAVTE